jgi:[acyl-carrier-protein] S-malonyltransferase
MLGVEAPPSVEQEPQPKTVWLFPGQGIQEPGLGQWLYENSPAARNVYDIVELTLAPYGAQVKEWSFNSQKEVQLQTRVTQLIIFTYCNALLEYWKEQEREDFTQAPALAVGHSLGEVSLLPALGIASLEETAILVNARGTLMNEDAEREDTGLMATRDKLTEGETAYLEDDLKLPVALINTSKQTVYGGRKPDLIKASERLGRKVTILPVSGSPHTYFMTRAREGYAKVLGKTNIQDSSTPFIANTTGRLVIKAAEIKNELEAQLTTTVNFLKAIKYFGEKGIDRTHEISEQGILLRMIQSELGGNIIKTAAAATITGAIGTAAMFWLRHHHEQSNS